MVQLLSFLRQVRMVQRLSCLRQRWKQRKQVQVLSYKLATQMEMLLDNPWQNLPVRLMVKLELIG
jgi:hypothetical protein